MAEPVIDAHVHIFSAEQAGMLSALLDAHGVDRALGLSAIGLSKYPEANESILEAVRAFPDRFPVAMVGFSTPQDLSSFDGEAAAREIEPYLKMPEVAGVGEWALEAVGGWDEWADVWPRLRPIMDAVAEAEKCVCFHTGMAPFPQKKPAVRSNGRDGWISHRSLWWHNPVFLDDVAAEYPDVPIIVSHVGVQGCFFYGAYADMALMLAARNPNVYLETSSAPAEVVAKAVCEPAIGPSRVLFGTDTPAPFDYYRFEDKTYPSYAGMFSEPERLRDHYPECLGIINGLSLDPGEKQMILGGNAKRLLRL
jgi:predicted TIM-barrel fold metal-dependent hydrolase